MVYEGQREEESGNKTKQRLTITQLGFLLIMAFPQV
jgi:hypothetical protein